MSLLRRRLLAAAFRVYDLVVLIVALLLAFRLVYAHEARMPLADLLSLRIRLVNFLLLALLLWIWHTSFVAFGLYESRRLAPPMAEVTKVIQASVWTAFVLGIAGWLFEIEAASIAFVFMFWAVTVTCMLGGRVVMRFLVGRLRVAGHNRRHVLLIGTNPRAIALAERLEEETSRGYEIVGFIDDGWSGGAPESRWPLLGAFDDFGTVLRAHVVDEVILCLPVKSFYHVASRVAALSEEQGIVVRALADVFDVKFRRVPLTHHLEQVIDLSSEAISASSMIRKRAIDIAVASALLVLASPLFLLIPLLIRLESPGPVFFFQTRRGLNKRPFRMIKFRSMRADAEVRFAEVAHLSNAGGPSFKIACDPRITSVGRILRRTSLDELPQLINVLKGEMSLVGPRPLFAYEFDRIDAEWIKRRCSVKPGLTGLWQVSGRSDLPFDERIQLDLEYIDKWSIGLDLRILARTLPAVVLGKGAV